MHFRTHTHRFYFSHTGKSGNSTTINPWTGTSATDSSLNPTSLSFRKTNTVQTSPLATWNNKRVKISKPRKLVTKRHLKIDQNKKRATNNTTPHKARQTRVKHTTGRKISTQRCQNEEPLRIQSTLHTKQTRSIKQPQTQNHSTDRSQTSLTFQDQF